MQRVLIVDDLPEVRGQIKSELASLEAELLEAGDGLDALEVLRTSRVDVVVSDVRMPGLDGLGLLRALKGERIPTLLHSGYTDVNAAIEAVRLGALDFFPAPIDFGRLRLRIEHCLSRGGHVSETLIGSSREIESIRRLVIQVADEDDPVLIVGESGVGKEVVARVLHKASRRSEDPFEVLNCGVPSPGESLDEHNWNAVLAAVGGGALLLDEIADASSATQKWLAEHLVRGPAREQSPAPRPRILASTRKDLPTEAASGRFSEDLWYALSVLQIYISPLRGRPEDIAVLANHELERLSEERGGIPFELNQSGVERLQAAAWPGNVRELQIALRRMVILAGPRRILDRYDVDEALRAVTRTFHPRTRFEENEREETIALLDAHEWNVSAAARAIGRDRGWLRRRMARLGLD